MNASMNIGTFCVPSHSYYCPQEKTKTPTADNSMTYIADSPSDAPTPSSPLEPYQALSDSRTQAMEDLGLHYIDAGNCTWAEFQKLCSQVLERTEYDAVPLEDLGISMADETAKMDCLNFLRRWSEQEADRGNMVGYHMGKRLSGAIANYIADTQGKTEYMEVDGKQVKIHMMEDNTFLKSPHLGSAYATDNTGKLVSFDARYADDSTAENPIIEIHTYNENGNKLEQIYRVALSEVDPRNATQLEIFALCVHRDKQGLGNPQERYGDSSYLFGKNLGLFPETSVSDFTEWRWDWIQAFADKIEEIRTLLETAALGHLTQKYMIGNFELTSTEWEKLLDQLENHLSQITSLETAKEETGTEEEIA